ncbi:FAD-binding oxidoreductase [Microbacterium sp. ASV49]|uniref:FAD-binding oxidoreductase n=1 Tax=Microbacterium candidum TaxID=3041922 RepID=A0ABT7N135_9MICO|nr:FAD-binding oxidoreductase [Microbacterium sp. ASV49]MDL9980419.1 FAD-binding oxidoreductase [Microbacterium sp. ASV49]
MYDTTLALPARGESTEAPHRRTDALRELAGRITGSLVLPSDHGWDDARRAWNLAVDQRPAAVAVPETTADVVAIVRTAIRLGMRVAAQTTGHNAGPLAHQSLRDTILVRFSAMREVRIDAERRRARVEAGAVWGDVVAPAAEAGLAALAGSSADVGVAGYVLGGGLSWLARAKGLAANHVLAFEVVTASGDVETVDAAHHADLFWALRGGGGDFAIVTAIHVRLFSITSVQAGTMLWPAEQVETVLSAWRSWVDTAPDEITSVGRILHLPPLPDLPPHLAGRSFVAIEAVSLFDADLTAALLAPLRALRPEIDTIHETPMTDLHLLHMDPPGPVPGLGDGMLLTTVDADDLAGIVEAVGVGSGTALLSFELRHLGGALSPDRAPADGGAVRAFDAEFAMYAVGIAPTPDAQAAVRASVARVMSALAPRRAAQSYINFVESARTADTLWDDGLERLRAVKREYDPTGLVRSNHPVD